jgi:hypothetical protein
MINSWANNRKWQEGLDLTFLVKSHKSSIFQMPPIRLENGWPKVTQVMSFLFKFRSAFEHNVAILSESSGL